MVSVDLRFAQAAGGTQLLFGGEQATGAPPLDATLQGALPALQFDATAIPNADFAAVATLPPLALIAQGTYKSYASRPTVGQLQTDWQYAIQFEAGVQDRREATERDRSITVTAWQLATRQRCGVELIRPGALMRATLCRTAMHQDAQRLGTQTLRTFYQESLRLRLARTSVFTEAQRGHWLVWALHHQDGLRDRRRQVNSGFQQAARQPGPRWSEASQCAHTLRRWWATRWQQAMVPPPGRHPAGPIAPPDRPPCYTPSGHLLLAALAAVDANLLFICDRYWQLPEPGQSVQVPIRRLYLVTNAVRLHRLPDGLELPVFNLSLSLDVDSWTWGFEAWLPIRAEALVDPGPSGAPVQLLASVNGQDFRLLAESIGRERSFGEASVRIAGRGHNAVLAAPYAPVMSFTNPEDRSARQLMDDVLTVNGVPLGWDIDWGLADWNVPAGAFTQHSSWIEALTTIASAAGAYLMPHPTAQTLRVRPRYPLPPWHWDQLTPDFVLPVDAVSRESLHWLDKPPYNRVYVSGQQLGILARVTKAGTAGDLLAPMVVDPLVTESAAARQRGIAILSDTGRQIEVRLRLPVMQDTGIIEPGAFVEYQDGSVNRLGLVRSTQLDARFPEAWQTLGVQAHA